MSTRYLLLLGIILGAGLSFNSTAAILDRCTMMLRLDADRVAEFMSWVNQDLESGDKTWGKDYGRVQQPGPNSHAFESRSYDPDFFWALDSFKFGSFRALLENRQRVGLGTHVLELFGSATWIPYSLQDRITAQSATGVRLTAVELSMSEQLRPIHQLVTGNLYLDETWDAITESLRRREIPSIDLVVLRPLGATPSDSHAEFNSVLGMNGATLPGLYLDILARAYEHLSVDGYLFAQLPQFKGHRAYYEKWVGILNKRGIKADIFGSHESVGPVLGLQKSKTAPFRLPILW